MNVLEDAQPFEGRPMSFEEWEAMDEDEPGELVDGFLVEEEEVGALHDVVVSWLNTLFNVWLSGRGIVGASDTKFKVSGRRGRKPDTYVYLPGRRPQARGLVTVPPDMVVEVVSPRPSDVRRDRIEKLVEYAAFGVRYFWILDPQVRSLEILGITNEGRYIYLLGATAGKVESVPGCEGLTIDLDDLWRKLDELEAPT